MADQRTDAEGKRLASRRVADSVRAKIQGGELEVGDPIPTYRQLAADEGVAVNTAMAGVRLLQTEGWVDIKPNAGAIVRDRSRDVGAEEELRGLRAIIEGLRVNLRRVGDDVADLDAGLVDVLARINAISARGGVVGNLEVHEDTPAAKTASPSSTAPPHSAN